MNKERVLGHGLRPVYSRELGKLFKYCIHVNEIYVCIWLFPEKYSPPTNGLRLHHAYVGSGSPLQRLPDQYAWIYSFHHLDKI